MSALTIEQATEAVYTSLNNDNEDINAHIENLKSALTAAGKKRPNLIRRALPITTAKAQAPAILFQKARRKGQF